MVLSNQFYQQPTLEIARKLLGTYLVVDRPEGRTVGRIVETESYPGDDPAAHSFKGPTKRNQPVFGPPGHLYVYMTYGMHFCCNVVTNQEGIGDAVLIRAVEPIDGIEIMQKRRKTDNIYQLCNGPAKLVQAMGITLKDNNLDLRDSEVTIHTPDTFGAKTMTEIVAGVRVGISKAKEIEYRFYFKDNLFVSRM